MGFIPSKKISLAGPVNNKKEAKREKKVKYNTETPPLCCVPSLTYHRHLESSQETDITRRALEVAYEFRLGCWSNNVANSHPSPGPFNHRVGYCTRV